VRRAVLKSGPVAWPPGNGAPGALATSEGAWPTALLREWAGGGRLAGRRSRLPRDARRSDRRGLARTSSEKASAEIEGAIADALHLLWEGEQSISRSGWHLLWQECFGTRLPSS